MQLSTLNTHLNITVTSRSSRNRVRQYCMLQLLSVQKFATKSCSPLQIAQAVWNKYSLPASTFNSMRSYSYQKLYAWKMGKCLFSITTAIYLSAWGL